MNTLLDPHSPIDALRVPEALGHTSVLDFPTYTPNPAAVEAVHAYALQDGTSLSRAERRRREVVDGLLAASRARQGVLNNALEDGQREVAANHRATHDTEQSRPLGFHRLNLLSRESAETGVPVGALLPETAPSGIGVPGRALVVVDGGRHRREVPKVVVRYDTARGQAPVRTQAEPIVRETMPVDQIISRLVAYDVTPTQQAIARELYGRSTKWFDADRLPTPQRNIADHYADMLLRVKNFEAAHTSERLNLTSAQIGHSIFGKAELTDTQRQIAADVWKRLNSATLHLSNTDQSGSRTWTAEWEYARTMQGKGRIAAAAGVAAMALSRVLRPSAPKTTAGVRAALLAAMPQRVL